jgi:hypothetical protein
MLGPTLRRFRRALVLPFVVVAVLWLRPGLCDSSSLGHLTDALGLLIAAAGKHGLRTKGPYALLRHPLYAGNFLILLGLLVVFNNTLAYPVFLVPFAYLYHTIARVEEGHMARCFGPAYENYTRQNRWRFFPQPDRVREALVSSRPFGWGFALGKEYESVLGLVAAALALNMYEEVLYQPLERTQTLLVGQGVLLAGLGALSLLLYRRKKVRSLCGVGAWEAARGVALGPGEFSLPLHGAPGDGRRKGMSTPALLWLRAGAGGVLGWWRRAHEARERDRDR